MQNFENEHIESRKYTKEDFIKRFTTPLFHCNMQFTMEPDDFMFEDTIPIYIALPRIAWKILYGAAQSTKLTPSEVASEWICDVAMDIISNMTPIDSKSIPALDILKEIRKTVNKLKNQKLNNYEKEVA